MNKLKWLFREYDVWVAATLIVTFRVLVASAFFGSVAIVIYKYVVGEFGLGQTVIGTLVLSFFGLVFASRGL